MAPVINISDHSLDRVEGEGVGEVLREPLMIIKVFLIGLLLNLLDVAFQLLRVGRDLRDAATFVDLHGAEHLVQVPAKQLTHEHVL